MRKSLMSGIITLLSLALLSGCAAVSDGSGVQLTQPSNTGEYRIVVTDANAEPDTAHEQTQLQNLMGIQMGGAGSVDMYEFEQGLVEGSKTVYSTENYFFRRGTFLNYSTVRSWLQTRLNTEELKQKRTENPQYIDVALNPSSDEQITTESGAKFTPYYLSYILGQDYVQQGEGGVVLKGLSVGLAVNASQTYKDASGNILTYKFSDQELTNFSKDAAEKIVTNIRQSENYRNLPVFISVYKTNSTADFLTGGHFLRGYAKPSEAISDWQNISSTWVLLSSDAMKKVDATIANTYTTFQTSIQSTFPSISSIMGEAKIVDNKVSTVLLDVDITSGSYMQAQAVKQYLEKSIDQNFGDTNASIFIKLKLYGQMKYYLTKTPGNKISVIEIA